MVARTRISLVSHVILRKSCNLSRKNCRSDSIENQFISLAMFFFFLNFFTFVIYERKFQVLFYDFVEFGETTCSFFSFLFFKSVHVRFYVHTRTVQSVSNNCPLLFDLLVLSLSEENRKKIKDNCDMYKHSLTKNHFSLRRKMGRGKWLCFLILCPVGKIIKRG